MEHVEGPIHAMSAEESWEFLAKNSLGRIVTNVHDVVDIFPVNYYADGSSLLFRTAPGSKLLELTINDQVIFEVDGFDEFMGWSVVIRGTARAIDSQEEIFAANETPLQPWIPTLKHIFVRITPEHLNGVRFDRGPEPERE